MRPAAVLAGVAVGLLLAGCGSPRGVLEPVAADVPGTGRVDMLVTTTRGPARTAGEMFSGDRGEMAFANLVVSIPPDARRESGTVQWPASLPGNPATDFVTTRADVLTREGAVRWFNRKIRTQPGRRVLLFVHGFNNRFEEAVYRFAQIVHDAKAPAVPVLFTWPSRGSIFAYGYDRESTTYSRNALENLLRVLSRDPQVGEITILAHSMGNLLTLESLRQMAIRDGRVAPKIRDVLLAAPDVDVDLALGSVRDMGARRPSLTLFASADDRALAVSRRVWGDSVRLGAIMPDQEPYRTELARADIRVIDLTKLKAGSDPLNHAKFAESPELVRIIGQRLADGQALTESHSTIGTRLVEAAAGAAGAVGSAATFAVAAPLAVVDPQAREELGYHARRVGESLGDTAVSAGNIVRPVSPR